VAQPRDTRCMQIVRSLPDLIAARTALAAAKGGLALVPTMGALHAGHLSLVRAARESGLAVAVSIFVNPLQFGPNEDLARYPRDEAGDLALLRAEGCDLVWLPTVEAMYPPGDATAIDVGGPALAWEGAERPGHFRGVATVVAKLFGQMRPRLAFFGEKDWQQLQVIRRMVSDLLLPVEVRGVPVARDADGLALSSRNRFLSPEERRCAPLLHTVLRELADSVCDGTSVEARLQAARARLTAAGFDVNYLALVHAESLGEIAQAQPPARLLAAARLGSVRLLDNVPVL
jgi:pantoate--beta-alanine ligase